MLNQKINPPNGWLAFELNVLRRLKFSSVAIPFTSEPNLGVYLKRWNTRVSANDALQSAHVKAVAAIRNNSETLTDEDVNTILEDAYVPRYRLQNQSLRNWFNESDAWWFDNVRQNIERLSSPLTKAVALQITMQTGDYLLSFAGENLELRQPLSNVFRRLRSVLPAIVNNGQNNVCRNQNADDFLADAENRADLMFLRLPKARQSPLRESLGKTAWREEFVRGADDFWGEIERAQSNRLGNLIETKSQYLHLLEETLRRASNIGTWAVAHVEDGFISTQDIVEAVGHVRRVDTIYTKDFSELTGAKAVIITA